LEKTHNVRALLRAVRNERWSETSVVLPAVDALGRLQDPRACDPLLAAYQKRSGEGGQRRRVAFGAALAALGDLRSLRLLYEAMEEGSNGDERGRAQAAQAIRRLGDRAFEAAVPSRAGCAVLPQQPPQVSAQRTGIQRVVSAARSRMSGGVGEGADRLEQGRWLTADAALAIAGASGDPRARDVLSDTLFAGLRWADGMAGAVLGLGWSQDSRAVEPLIAALLMGLVLQRFDVLGCRQRLDGSGPLPPRIQALLRDLQTEKLQADARPECTEQSFGERHAPLMFWLVATIALGRLRHQQAAAAILLGALYGAPDGLPDDGLSSAALGHVIGRALRQTGGLPIVTEVAGAIQEAGFAPIRLSRQALLIKQALLQLGVAVPDPDPLDQVPGVCGQVGGRPAARAFAILPTDQLRLLGAFVRTEHLQALVREELLRRALAEPALRSAAPHAAAAPVRHVRPHASATRYPSYSSYPSWTTSRRDPSMAGSAANATSEPLVGRDIPLNDPERVDAYPPPVLIGR
jgi:hypothetical protein